MSKRQDFIDLVVATIDSITDFANVADSETQWQQDEMPACSVFDPMTTQNLVNDEPEAFGQDNLVNLKIQIFTSRGTKAAAVRDLQQKINQKIAANKYWNDGTDDLAYWTKPVSTSIDYAPSNPEQTTFEIVGGSQEFSVFIQTDAFDF